MTNIALDNFATLYNVEADIYSSEEFKTKASWLLNETRLEVLQQIILSLSEQNRSQSLSPILVTRLRQLVRSCDVSNPQSGMKLCSFMLQRYSSVSLSLIHEIYKKVLISQFPNDYFSHFIFLEEIKTLHTLKQQKHPSRSFVPLVPVQYREIDTFLAKLSAETRNKLWMITSPIFLRLHVVPVFIKKENGHWSFMILDSIGIRDKKGKISQTTLEWVKRIKEVDPQSKIYFYDQQRQFDEETCAIFTYNDVLKFNNEIEAKTFAQPFTPIDLHQDEEWKQLSEELQRNVFTFQYLPNRLMSLTQSAKLIAKYKIDYPNEISSSLKSRSVETLDENIRKYTFIESIKGEDKPVNLKAEYKYSKYLLRVLQHHLNPK